ncbi:MAG: GntR family transcriptional regulator [Bacteroidales bacterium]|nr:GntR family transcriptional regulator [Bacteroidales bacterium]
MEFKKQQPIFRQIADQLCSRIVEGEWKEDEHIASVREVAVELGVTPNTVMRSFDWLSQQEVIYNRRGTGYYVAPSACQRILDMQRSEFLNYELPAVIAKMKMLHLSIDDISHLFKDEE